MDSGQIVFAYSRLILGAIAAFLAIMLWSKTRDMAWMLVVMGVITAYIEIVYSLLEWLGITMGAAGSVSLIMILLTIVRMFFFIAALVVVLVRQYRRH